MRYRGHPRTKGQILTKSMAASFSLTGEKSQVKKSTGLSPKFLTKLNSKRQDQLTLSSPLHRIRNYSRFGRKKELVDSISNSVWPKIWDLKEPLCFFRYPLQEGIEF
jgi:hypothetical protein